MKKNDGGFLFPQIVVDFDLRKVEKGGISRRDWLAGLAMQGMFANEQNNARYGNRDIARFSYQAADEMIAQGEKE